MNDSRQGERLESGGQIDRSRPVVFRFNGRRLTGYAGDTLASALLANGIKTVARSFKFHRPRGILSAGVEEPNALLRVRVGDTVLPMTRATLQPLVDGLEAKSENCYPSVDFDVGRGLDLLHRFWPAGFYNKTFMWPRWETYEGLIRRAAGLGEVPAENHQSRYFHHNLHCDVLVVGGGVSGLAAALAAQRAGANVVLVEQDRIWGGRLAGEQAEIQGRPARTWIDEAVSDLKQSDRVRLMIRTTIAGYYDHNVLTAHDQSDVEHAGGRIERFWRIRASHVVLATGAIEQPLVFGHNDRPGILLAGAVRQYLHRYAVAPGRQLLVFTSHDEAYQTALDWHDAGLSVAAVIDVRASAGQLVTEAARSRGLTVLMSSSVTHTRGRPAVTAARIHARSPAGHAPSQDGRWIECDLVAMSAGWNPTVHLYSQAGGKVEFDSHLQCIVPSQCRQHVSIVGGANGEFSLGAAICRAGQVGDAAAAGRTASGGPGNTELSADRASGFNIFAGTATCGDRSDRQWVDFAHDVTRADIELAVRENYVSVEHLKRYTTNGMSIDQGKTSNLNALKILAELTGRSVNEVGTTTFRPMFQPVSMGAIGGPARGELYAPRRLLPAHDWHRNNGAHFDDYGGWQRPACYPTSGESTAAAIEREVLAVRRRVGLFDGSSLGKIEIIGRDAAAFLDRIYVNNALTLQPGKLRYGLMLRESGVVFDDGVFGCLAPRHYLVNSTSGNADRVASWLDEWHQCEWPDLDVVIVPVSSQWAVIAVAGPAARTVLQGLNSDIDFSAAAFPHMNIRSGRVDGMPVRVQRVSFSGELSYEVAVPADRAEQLCQRLLDMGKAAGIMLTGLEAWVTLRLEKGFLHVGGDTDGTTNPFDVGFGPIIAKKTGDFVGRRSLLRPNDRREDRRQLVGLSPVSDGDRLVAGAHVIATKHSVKRSEGFVTSACFSPTLRQSIALGLLERGQSRLGETVQIFDRDRTLLARVVPTAFYDPAGERMHA